MDTDKQGWGKTQRRGEPGEARRKNSLRLSAASASLRLFFYPCASVSIRGSKFWFPKTEKPLRGQNHQHDDEQRVEDHAIFREAAQKFRQQRQEDRRDDDAGRAAHAAEDDHHYDVYALEKIEAGRREKLFVVRVKSASDAREECAEHERGDLVAHG